MRARSFGERGPFAVMISATLSARSITREHRFCTNVQADTCPRCGFACSGNVCDACCTPPACATATSISMTKRAFPLIPKDSSESASRCGEAVGPSLNSVDLVPLRAPHSSPQAGRTRNDSRPTSQTGTYTQLVTGIWPLSFDSRPWCSFLPKKTRG